MRDPHMDDALDEGRSTVNTPVPATARHAAPMDAPVDRATSIPATEVQTIPAERANASTTDKATTDKATTDEATTDKSTTDEPPVTDAPVVHAPTSFGLSPATRVLITLAAASVVIAGFSLGREIIAPFVLATVIVILVHPIRGILERRGVPRKLASLAVILSAYAILAAMIYLLYIAVRQFVALITDSTPEILALYDTAVQWLSDQGFAATDLTGTDGILNPDSLISAGTSLLGSLSGIGTAFFFILAYVIFMAVDASRFNHIPSALLKAKGATIASFARYSHSVRVYFGVNTVFGLIVAILDGVLLFILDVPGAIIWTILAFVTNFIPNIGFIIGLIPAAIFALLFGGPVTALIVIAAYIVINVVMQTLVQPKFVSDAVHLSLTLTFASVIFWAFVLGPLGALLAVPLSLLMRELLIGTDKNADFSLWITSDTPSKVAS